MIDAFVDVLTDAATDDSLRAIHIRGEGDDFCSGADWVATNSGGQRPRTGDLVRRIPHTANGWSNSSQPSTCPWCAPCGVGPSASAAISRWPPTSRWQPTTRCSGSRSSPAASALIPASTWLLPRLVGLARAKRMLLLGEKVRASDAAEWGLIHDAVDPAGLDEAAEKLLAQLAAAPTVAIGLAKQAIHYGQHATLPQTMNQELFNLELSCRTTDFKEGLAAFRENAHTGVQRPMTDDRLDEGNTHGC